MGRRFAALFSQIAGFAVAIRLPGRRFIKSSDAPIAAECG